MLVLFCKICTYVDLSKSLMDVGTAINANVVPKLEIAVSRVEALG